MADPVKLDAVYKFKYSSNWYRVFDITGGSKNVPNADGRTIFLHLNSKQGWLDRAQPLIAMTERKFFDFFEEDSIRS